MSRRPGEADGRGTQRPASLDLVVVVVVVIVVVVVGRVGARTGLDDDEVLPAYFPVPVPYGGGSYGVLVVLVMSLVIMMQCESSSSPFLSSLRLDFDEEGWW